MSLLFSIFIAVSLKPRHCFLLFTFLLSFHTLSLALHVWHGTAGVPGKFGDSPVGHKRAPFLQIRGPVCLHLSVRMCFAHSTRRVVFVLKQKSHICFLKKISE